MKIIAIILLLLICISGALLAEEVLYPSSYNIMSYYSLSALSFSPNDTLTITRTITNNEAFNLSGIYFLENLPLQFNMVAYTIKLNGVNISHFYDNNVTPSIISGYRTLEWVVDDPDGNSHNIINPGGKLVLELKIVCTQTGQYQLPFHTAAFIGADSGLSLAMPR